MDTLLFDTLYYTDNNNDNNTNTYDSNMEKKIKDIEKNQAKQILSNSEYFQQFDSLTFDNVSKPSAINQSYNTKSGFNSFLQKDLDFQNEYSEFQIKDMHYDVVTKENFNHNNMEQFTSRRDTPIDLNLNSRKYESLSGNDPIWKHKTERQNLFQPEQMMHDVNSSTTFSTNMSNRYIPSLKNNNGALPFQTDVKVTPGLNGMRAAPYEVHRIEPKNIDHLRTAANQKISYKTKPLETIKKGNLGMVESKITTFKLPVYKENTLDDLVPNKYYVDAPKQTGQFVHIDTLRGVNDLQHYGRAYNPSLNNYTDTIKKNFTESKKENFLNDFTHSINAVNTKPVFQNIESYTNYETDRDIISQDIRASGIHDNNKNIYYIDKNHIAKTTMKENNVIETRTSGINGPIENKSYIFSNDNVLPVTIRETTSHNKITNPVTLFKNNNLLYTDKAKQTIKETTEIGPNTSNIKSLFQNNNGLFSFVCI